MISRLSLALQGGHVDLPDVGDVMVFGPGGAFDFGGLELSRIWAVQGFYPDYQALAQRGIATEVAEVKGSAVAAVVCVSKAKAETLDLIARACAVVPIGAPIVVDGAKVEGIESILKLCRAMADVTPAFSKAHGKTFSFANPGQAPEGWAAVPRAVEGFTTLAGVFSADGIDPGSRALIDVLPPLKGQVCDLGAGWGYLAGAALAKCPGIAAMDLVEADWTALSCARAAITDPRAAFHWGDARSWEGRYDAVLSNPPFHISRDSMPALGQAFIAQAARITAPRGQFVMVANRHLPYETTLRAAFAEIVVLAETGGYKVISARRPIKG
jgi:16S rRNA (guanine1207-N2)-methyltransferase